MKSKIKIAGFLIGLFLIVLGLILAIVEAADLFKVCMPIMMVGTSLFAGFLASFLLDKINEFGIRNNMGDSFPFDILIKINPYVNIYIILMSLIPTVVMIPIFLFLMK